MHLKTVIGRTAVIGRAVGIAVVLVGLLFGSPPYADTGTYTVGGGSRQFSGLITPPAGAPWGPNGYPGDTAALQAYTGTLDLAQATSLQKINTRLWTMNYTAAGTATDPEDWSNLSFDLNLARSVQFGRSGGPSADLTQAGKLEVTRDNDFLSVSHSPQGSTASPFTPGYQTDITPLDPPQVGGSSFPGFAGGNPSEQPAPLDLPQVGGSSFPRFSGGHPLGLTDPTPAVPDAGSTLILFGLALIGLYCMTRSPGYLSTKVLSFRSEIR